MHEHLAPGVPNTLGLLLLLTKPKAETRVADLKVRFLLWAHLGWEGTQTLEPPDHQSYTMLLPKRPMVQESWEMLHGISFFYAVTVQVT